MTGATRGAGPEHRARVVTGKSSVNVPSSSTEPLFVQLTEKGNRAKSIGNITNAALLLVVLRTYGTGSHTPPPQRHSATPPLFLAMTRPSLVEGLGGEKTDMQLGTGNATATTAYVLCESGRDSHPQRKRAPKRNVISSPAASTTNAATVAAVASSD